MAVIDAAVLERHGIKPDEYERILELMGREPNLLELGLFSVMWSEHCSYKSSRVHLKTLPTTGPRVVQGPGENAGAVDIGGGLCAVFKIESHNHPSFIEPYQGAATGVGGIHGLESESEDILVQAMSFADALALLSRDEIDNSAAVIALQWLALHRDELRSRWR